MADQDDDITFYRNLPPLPFVPARDTDDPLLLLWGDGSTTILFGDGTTGILL